MMIAQIAAVVLGALVVTTEYGTGMIRSTFAAVPSRGRVLAAKAVVVAAVLFVVGTVTALVGYWGGNFFLDREGSAWRSGRRAARDVRQRALPRRHRAVLVAAASCSATPPARSRSCSP